MISYLSSIVTMSLSCTVSKILSLISQNLNTSRDHDYAHTGTICRRCAGTSYIQAVYQILNLYVHPLRRYEKVVVSQKRC